MPLDQAVHLILWPGPAAKDGIIKLPGKRDWSRRLFSWRRGGAGRRSRVPKAVPPLLAEELFDSDQLRTHALHLANQQVIGGSPLPYGLLDQLEANEKSLRAFNRISVDLDSRTGRTAPATEWLLDNFFLIEDQIQMSRRHLPRGYIHGLPCLSTGDFAGLPRVYQLILELILHVDAQIDSASLKTFVEAYQSGNPLTIGELWAIPIMLRLGLIENLQRISARLTQARADADLAEFWVERLREVAEESPSRLVIVVAEMAGSSLPISSSFVAEFCTILSRQSPMLHLARSWLEQHLGEHGLSIEHLSQQENQFQAADQVTVSHSITSLRFLSSMDWKKFVEEQSRIEMFLKRDPAGVYPSMDFATRDRYRRVVEKIARNSGIPEPEVASMAIDMATAGAGGSGCRARSGHVGYYLIDKGVHELERAAGVRWPWPRLLERRIRRCPLALYMGGIALMTLFPTAALLWLIQLAGVGGLMLTGCAAVLLIGTSQLAVELMNRLAVLVVKPRPLPRMDFTSGLEPESRTVVAVPTMLKSQQGIEHLIEMLEVHFLANQDRYLHFALLTDFVDAHQEELPSDAGLLEQACAGIDLLNSKYAAESRDRFFLFHRPRKWNSSEAVWMGFERKRGKLADFNSVLRGGSQECYSMIAGDPAALQSVRYVITLDTDTTLPRESALMMAGAMAHPLNRPVVDPDRGIVTEGYGILQPRIGASPACARESLFVRLGAGEVGVDPYTQQISDVYQDLFGEGSFIGKGIYDVDAFRKVTEGRFPENSILSHDLLEGCYVRSGLLNDVTLYECYPSRYNVDVGRRHRWIRGDWQNIQWVMPHVREFGGRRTPNPLSALSRWKIFDNLRRSLAPISQVLLFLGGWLLLPEAAGVSTIVVLTILAFPTFLSLLAGVLFKPVDLPWVIHLRTAIGTSGRLMAQFLLSLTFLPYEAFSSLKAIAHTLLRIAVTHKRCLEWQTSSDADAMMRAGLAGFHRVMWISPAISILTAGLLIGEAAGPLVWASPVLVLWAVAPAVGWWVSRFTGSKSPGFTPDQMAFLRRSARRHWHYFETFVTAEENWLPPDNMQEHPTPRVASRTSPTNMGLALLANMAACDFGYLSVGGLIQRTRDTLHTMHRLDRYRRHFYNWYETRSLKPMPPHYVSSVDSGNLAGHLMALSNGLREQADEKIMSRKIFTALQDTADVLVAMIPENAALVGLIGKLDTPPKGLHSAVSFLEWAVIETGRIESSVIGREEQVTDWARTLRKNCEEQLADLRYVAPWVEVPLSGVGQGVFPDGPPNLGEVADFTQTGAIQAFMASTEGSENMNDAIRLAAGRAASRISELESLACQCEELAAMDFTFLFDASRKLFVTGFNVGELRSDDSRYDLLASEARQCSFVAIALGQVPQDHWFALGRLMVASRGKPALASWTGSMFEYLMPLLVMPNFERTLLDQTCKSAVREQIAYGRQRGVPWGISESACNRTDPELNYQYRAFGVPGLGLKRGLAEDLVIAPYASVLALMVDPAEACSNLQRLAREGLEGSFGFYEAVDYTPSRIPPDETSVTIRSFMVHHQGMSLLALDNVLHSSPMQRRFMDSARVKATELVLQERVPGIAVGILSGDRSRDPSGAQPESEDGTVRVFTDPNPPVPEIHLLSNGNYHVAISSAGAGYSRWRDIALTRWREDATRDCRGLFIYLQDEENGDFWSTAYQPAELPVDRYEASFSQARAEFQVHRGHIEAHTRISVSPEDDVELRRICLTNHSTCERVIVLTSYAEVVLAPQMQDEAHPAFSNLFVQTEFHPRSSAILATRRSRSIEEKPPWLLHMILDTGVNPGEISCETDRSRFIGRGGSPASPAAMGMTSPLSNTVGSVLDPVAALRRRVVLPAQGKVIIHLVLGATETRDEALAIVQKYQGVRMAERAFDLAWVHSQVLLHQLDASEADVQLYSRMAGALVYANPGLRANPAVLANNKRGQSGLWGYGISGDAPLVLVRVSGMAGIELVGQLVRAHAYWRLRGLAVDLVLVNENTSVYHEALHERIIDLIASGKEAQLMDRPGGIFVRRLEHIPSEDQALMQAAARIVLDDRKGKLFDQLVSRWLIESYVPPLKTSRSGRSESLFGISPRSPAGKARTRGFPESSSSNPPSRDLIYDNGIGGFTRDGHEYVITLREGMSTPMPWVNVMANPYFGTMVSESGAAYTWMENAREFRLTPWNNDPIEDPPGEAIYIRDEESGTYWSPTPYPARGSNPYVIRHGFGYTVFEHTENGIASELWVYVAINAPLKYSVLKCRNVSGRPRRLSVTSYCEWVLGDFRRNSLLHVRTEVDPETGALLARNPYNTEFGERFAFLDVHDMSRTLTGHRTEFIGRHGSMARPSVLERARLSGRVGAGLDPCGAVQVAFDLASGAERETRFRLGAGKNRQEVQGLIRRSRETGSARRALEAVWEYWNRTLGAISLDTPDSSVNIMGNGWLLYQTLSCRMWGRTGFYQSGGAYGFRDQLQDSMALVHSEPSMVREHLLRAAARQFREGDVQHWWHPPTGRGVRTQFSDDFLWLPYVVCHYVTSVGDTGVLEEDIPFLESRLLQAEEESLYELPNVSAESASLYDHCVRAIEHALRFGEHGLPLIGCGDWNDGMNRIGNEGRGESVWLGFFLFTVLHRFARLAEANDDPHFAERCRTAAAELEKNLEAHAWDGQWYLRAYFDDGTPLGSHTNPECQIDSLPQSWAVLSGAGNAQRARKAMDSVVRRLVFREDRIVKLFDPPFDKSDLNPGYIRGYSPGVRENGGQYTHGAIWVAMAMAQMGQHERAWELFALLNPIHHGGTPGGIETYKVEPYVVAADVYGVAPHTGRGGWSWYTGSAAWLYRLLTETLLGVHREGDRLRLTPCPPRDWNGFRIHYRYHATVYHITFTAVTSRQPGSMPLLTLDGMRMPDNTVPLHNDCQEHFVMVEYIHDTE